jgi:hypothetical protein
VCVLGQAAQCKCSHLLECKVGRGQHANKGRHAPALYNARLVVCRTHKQQAAADRSARRREQTLQHKTWIGAHAWHGSLRLLCCSKLTQGIPRLSDCTHTPGPSSLGVCVANWPSSSAASRWLSGHVLLSRLMTGCSAPSCRTKQHNNATQVGTVNKTKAMPTQRRLRYASTPGAHVVCGRPMCAAQPIRRISTGCTRPVTA